MPRPAENQQTVGALAAAIEHWVREQMSPLSTPQSRTDAKIAGRAALRDLVAQAELAADTRGPICEALELIAKLYRNPSDVPYGERLDVDQKLRSLLARLDGAR